MAGRNSAAVTDLVPSTTTPTTPPWDSPKLVTTKRSPKELPGIVVAKVAGGRASALSWPMMRSDRMRSGAGETVELTRRGRPVAVVLSREVFERLSSGRQRFGVAYRAFLERFSLAEVGLDDDVFATARDRSPGRKLKL